MFRKVFKSISKALGSKEEEAAAVATPPAPAPKAAPAPTPAPPPEKPKGKASQAAPAPQPAPKAVPAPAVPKKSPEELCEITSKMSKEEIKSRLAFLYRRYNRATSSLDPKLRAEADVMLDAVVVIREKVFGAM